MIFKLLILQILFISSGALAQDTAEEIIVEPTFNEAAEVEKQQYMKEMVESLEKTKNEVEKIQSIIKYFDGPALQILTRVVQNEEIRATATNVFDKKKWKLLAICQFIGILFIIVFRAWRASKAKSFLAKLWVSFYSSFLYMGVSLYIIPVLVFGQGYRSLIVEIYKVATA